MDISAIEGEELKAVSFVEDYLQLGFGGPILTLYNWPFVMLTDFSVAFGEPEYRNALCAQIGEQVAAASLEEDSALTIELANGVVYITGNTAVSNPLAATIAATIVGDENGSGVTKY